MNTRAYEQYKHLLNPNPRYMEDNMVEGKKEVLKRFDAEVQIMVTVQILGIPAASKEDAKEIALADSVNYLSLPGNGFVLERNVTQVVELPSL